MKHLQNTLPLNSPLLLLPCVGKV